MIGTSLTGTQGTRQEAASDIYRSLFYPGTFVREDKRSIRNQTSVTNFRNRKSKIPDRMRGCWDRKVTGTHILVHILCL